MEDEFLAFDAAHMRILGNEKCLMMMELELITINEIWKKIC